MLNRACWSPRAVARRLLGLVVERLVPDGPIVIGMDDTIERRWGHRISARGIYRDPVRSSHGHFVKASGPRWLSFMVLTPVPWTSLVKALPVLTLLASSERSDHQRGRRHKLLTDWARQGALQLCRWLPGRRIIFVGDSSFAVHELGHAITARATLISRLRLDASLFAPPPKRRALQPRIAMGLRSAHQHHHPIRSSVEPKNQPHVQRCLRRRPPRKSGSATLINAPRQTGNDKISRQSASCEWRKPCCFAS
ncbi:transposase [Mesorhizobium sp. M0208]|uniref:transposase n=1 Tax=Mesorhizobium sp. M0208 TaxID=2956916 RepID=UPI003336DA74